MVIIMLLLLKKKPILETKLCRLLLTQMGHRWTNFHINLLISDSVDNDDDDVDECDVNRNETFKRDRKVCIKHYSLGRK